MAPAGTRSDGAAGAESLRSDSPPAQPDADSSQRESTSTPTFQRPAILDEANITVQELYRAYCGACHSLELVELQRLDRSNWEWVVDDMIDQYGAAWITDNQRAVIIDYLVAHLGPKAPR